MKCPICKSENDSSAHFCVECGTPFFKKCSSCQSETVITAKFCPRCGKAFDMKNDALERYKRKLNFYDWLFIGENKRGAFARIQTNDKWGVINLRSFTQVIPCEFDNFKDASSIYHFDTSYILLKKDDRWHLYEPFTGRKITNDTFEECKIEDNYNGCHIRVKKEGLWGRISGETGNYILYPRYEELTYDNHAKLNGYWGLVKGDEYSRTKIVIPFEYIKLETSCDNDKPRPSQHKNGKWGVILSYGEKLIEFEYDEIKYYEPFGHSLYYLRKGSLWGLYYSDIFDKDKFFPCQYSYDELKNLKY